MLAFKKVEEEEEDNTFLIVRDNEIKTVQKNIMDVNELMHSVYDMVSSQSEHVDNIQTNVNQSNIDVEQGRKELEQVEDHEEKLCCCLNKLQVMCGFLIFTFLAVLIITIVLLLKYNNH